MIEMKWLHPVFYPHPLNGCRVSDSPNRMIRPMHPIPSSQNGGEGGNMREWGTRNGTGSVDQHAV